MKNISKKINKKKSVENILGITPDLISKVIFEVYNNNTDYIMSIIDELHPADTADLLETLSGEERKRIPLNHP